MGYHSSSSVEIEYKVKERKKSNTKPGKKVRLVSEETDEPAVQKKKKPVKINERPKWGATKAASQKPVKQSEKDPYYEKRKKTREAKKAERTQQLLNMQEKNNPRNVRRAQERAASRRSKSPPLPSHRARTNSPPIPTLQKHSPPVPALQGMDEVDTGHFNLRTQRNTQRTHRSPSPKVSSRRVISPPRTNRGLASERKSPRDPSPFRTNSPPVPALQKPNQFRSNSPPVPSLRTQNQSDFRSNSPPVPTLRAQNQTNFRSNSPPVPALRTQNQSDFRSSSPPVPALRTKMEVKNTSPRAEQHSGGDFTNDYHLEDHSYQNYKPKESKSSPRTQQPHSKYGDPEPVRRSGDRTEFIPFTRTTAVLDPEHADDPVPVSREQTKIERARKNYEESHQPGFYGSSMDNYRDMPRSRMEPEEQGYKKRVSAVI